MVENRVGPVIKKKKKKADEGIAVYRETSRSPFSSFSSRIQWVSWLVKLEGELDTAVFFAFFVKLVLAIAATEMEMGQITHFSSDVKSGIWFDLQQLNFH